MWVTAFNTINIFHINRKQSAFNMKQSRLCDWGSGLLVGHCFCATIFSYFIRISPHFYFLVDYKTHYFWEKLRLIQQRSLCEDQASCCFCATILAYLRSGRPASSKFKCRLKSFCIIPDTFELVNGWLTKSNKELGTSKLLLLISQMLKTKWRSLASDTAFVYICLL